MSVETVRLKRLIGSLKNGSWGEEPSREGEGIPCVRAADFDYPSLRATLQRAPLRGIPSRQVAALALRRGDLVLEKSGGGENQPVGRAVLYGLPDVAVCSNFAARLRPADGVDSQFMTYLLAALYSNGATERCIKQTTGIQNLDTAAWLETPVPNHSLTDQLRIANFLSVQVARIDEIIRLRDEQVAALKNRLNACLGLLFCGEGLPDVVLRRVVSRWIDYRGATPKKTLSGVPLVTAKNIRGGVVQFGSSREFIAEGEYGEWMRRGLPRSGDVLLTTEAPLGEVAQVDDEHVALAQRIILLRPDPKRLDARWLYWFLRSPQGQFQLWSRATGTTAPGIKAERLREVPIPCPELPAQRSLITEIETREEELVALIPEMREQISLLVERRWSLITSAVMGEFDVACASGRGATI